MGNACFAFHGPSSEQVPRPDRTRTRMPSAGQRLAASTKKRASVQDSAQEAQQTTHSAGACSVMVSDDMVCVCKEVDAATKLSDFFAEGAEDCSRQQLSSSDRLWPSARCRCPAAEADWGRCPVCRRAQNTPSRAARSRDFEAMREGRGSVSVVLVLDGSNLWRAEDATPNLIRRPGGGISGILFESVIEIRPRMPTT